MKAAARLRLECLGHAALATLTVISAALAIGPPDRRVVAGITEPPGWMFDAQGAGAVVSVLSGLANVAWVCWSIRRESRAQ